LKGKKPIFGPKRSSEVLGEKDRGPALLVKLKNLCPENFKDETSLLASLTNQKDHLSKREERRSVTSKPTNSLASLENSALERTVSRGVQGRFNHQTNLRGETTDGVKTRRSASRSVERRRKEVSAQEGAVIQRGTGRSPLRKQKRSRTNRGQGSSSRALKKQEQEGNKR